MKSEKKTFRNAPNIEVFPHAAQSFAFYLGAKRRKRYHAQSFFANGHDANSHGCGKHSFQGGFYTVARVHTGFDDGADFYCQLLGIFWEMAYEAINLFHTALCFFFWQSVLDEGDHRISDPINQR